MSSSLRGQSSGDFKETSGRVQIFHVVTRNAFGAMTTDSLTQLNPPKVSSTHTSTTLATVTKVGVLGSSVAFTRPDAGNGLHGGPNTASYTAGCRPLGIFINDAVGNAFENTPGVASGRAPYLCGSGTCIGLSVYETKTQLSGPTTVTYAAGDLVFASVNGYVTNVLADAYEGTGGSNVTPVTVLGVVKVAPDSTTTMLVIDLRV
jgi:hypothetical protein